MPIDFQTREFHVSPGEDSETKNIVFRRPVQQYVVGLSKFHMHYQTDHWLQQCSIDSNVQKVDEDILQVTVEPKLQEPQSGNFGAATVDVGALAVTGTEEDGVVFGTRDGIGSGQSKGSFSIPSNPRPTFIGATLDGFNLKYPSNHWVEEIAARASSVSSGKNAQLSCEEAVMHDASNHEAKDPTIDASLIALPDGLGVQVRTATVEPSESHVEVSFDEPVHNWGILLRGFDTAYDHSDHWIEQIGCGYASANLSLDQKTLTIEPHTPMMSDSSGHRASGKNDLIVLGFTA